MMLPRIALLAGAAISLGAPTVATAQVPGIVLAPHRAVYELKLARSESKSAITSVRGRILYDFTGSACEGYGLVFRQVSELNNGEGRVTLSDLRSTTWEDGAGKSYRFQSENQMNQRVIDQVEGKAERDSSAIALTLTKPKALQSKLESVIRFPTEHIALVIEAARAGKTLLEVPIYDGAEKGEKIYNTLTVIGREIPAGEKTPSDAAAGQTDLAKLRRWPVTISYFDRSAPSGSGEQLPIYSIGFELYENGISRALMLDYNDFAISGEMTSLDVKPTKACP